MTGIIDLSEPTGYFEVAVFHYGNTGDGMYDVETDRGLGRCAVYSTDNKDKALGVAEYVESERRHYLDDDGELIANEGTPFDGSVIHWSCHCG